MAVVLAIVGLLAALFLPLTNTMMDNNRRKDTRAKLEALEAAMTRFVMTNRRLPCPADGALAPASGNYGLESRGDAATGVCAAVNTGVVPWKTLGLGVSDATDSWGTLVTYRVWARVTLPANGVDTSLTMDDGMKMTDCDPARTGATNNWACDPLKTTGPMQWLIADNNLAQRRGFRACRNACAATILADPPGADELARRVDGNGIAYFLISHGANKIYGYTPTGVFINTASGAGPGLREATNTNNSGLRTGSPDDFYIDADYDENPATYYDDIVLRPTVIQVAIDAGLGPRRLP
jgi:type II secretory pathway pseudopilin PulG